MIENEKKMVLDDEEDDEMCIDDCAGCIHNGENTCIGGNPSWCKTTELLDN